LPCRGGFFDQGDMLVAGRKHESKTVKPRSFGFVGSSGLGHGAIGKNKPADPVPAAKTL
jgi:hypothetical protein